ncbi:MAG: YfhO family protein [Bacteroidota bacterium]
MSKVQQGRTGTRQVREEFPFIPPKYQHATAIGVLLLSLVIFFFPLIFGGKTFLAADNIASHSWDTFLKDAKDAGVFPLWNPYIFCGMPSYGSLMTAGDRAFDVTATVLARATELFQLLLLNSPAGWVLFFYAAFAIGMYFFILGKVNSKTAALIGALGATFSMYIIIWIMVGHNTKIAVMAMFPFIFLILEKLRERFDFKLALVLVLLLHFSFLPSHVQMMFYMYLALGIYFLYFIVRNLVKKEDWQSLVKTGLVLALASGLAVTMDADKYLSVWEYNPYSMRGAAPIVPSVQKGEMKTQEGGLDYDYATSWSFSPGEMMTFVIPTWYGFGHLRYDGVYGKGISFNPYWGPMVFTDGAQYMGVVILALAILGFLRNRKQPFVQYLAITIVFSLLVSFGREFPLIYDLMFKYFPGFNKFRIPSMILVLVQIFVPILAAYGVASLLDEKERSLNPQSEKKWKYFLYGTAGFLALAIVARGAFKDIYTSFFPLKEVGNQVARAIGNGQLPIVSEFYNFVVDTVVTDLYFALAFILVTFGAFFFYWKNTIRLSTLTVILVGVTLFDLWRIDFRPMDPRDRKEQQDVFSAPDYVRFLQQDSSKFRILTFVNGQLPYDNTMAYWRIQSAYGYHGAKMRAYQDMVEVAGPGNPLVWQLMNVKYIVSDTPDSSQILQLVYSGQQYKVYISRASAPRAFFVNRYEVAGGLDILKKIQGMEFNPSDVAYLMDDPKVQIDPPQQEAKADFVSYHIQDLELKVTATGTNLLFLSEAYYPEGWKAFVDGAETKIYRLNYLFRGVVIPQGSHRLIMKFEPPGFYLGKNLSLGMNLLILGALAFVGFDYGKKWSADRTLNSKFETRNPKL